MVDTDVGLVYNRTMEIIQMVCSNDGSLVAELDAKWWKKVAPFEAYMVMAGGNIRYDKPGNVGKPELVCRHEGHIGRYKIEYRRVSR